MTLGYKCSKCEWPVCDADCEDGAHHKIECQTLAENKDNISKEAMSERNALYWPISALRILLKCKDNPVSWSIIKRMLSHREEQRKRETWPLYKQHLVDMIRQE